MHESTAAVLNDSIKRNNDTLNAPQPVHGHRHMHGSTAAFELLHEIHQCPPRPCACPWAQMHESTAAVLKYSIKHNDNTLNTPEPVCGHRRLKARLLPLLPISQLTLQLRNVLQLLSLICSY